jgi:alanine racemase
VAERGIYVEIDPACIVRNFEYLRSLADGAAVIAVVKADAYGHGAVEVAGYLQAAGANAFGVACTDEAVQLRNAGISVPIISFFSSSDAKLIMRYAVTPVVYDLPAARRLSDAALAANRRIDVHLDIDTGMGRIGFLHDRDIQAAADVCALKGLRVTGVMSHFSDADLDDNAVAGEQLKRFLTALKTLAPATGPVTRHMANSAASLSFADARLDALRPGLALYGQNPLSDNNPNLRPAMTVKTRVLAIRRIPRGRPVSYARTFITGRDSLIGVLPAGYADGYSRAFSNRARVIVGGKFAPVVGRVCMDTTMIDLTDLSGVREGDEVILMGRSGGIEGAGAGIKGASTDIEGASTGIKGAGAGIKGASTGIEVSADELASIASTISYEILTTLGRMNRRVSGAAERGRRGEI